MSYGMTEILPLINLPLPVPPEPDGGVEDHEEKSDVDDIELPGAIEDAIRMVF